MSDLVSYWHLALLLIAVGITGGFLSGMLGIGGGIIFVPALHFVFSRAPVAPEYVMHLAIATSLAAVSAAVVTSAVRRYQRGDMDMPLFRNWAPFQILGVLAGTLVASRVDSRALEILFAVIALCMSVYMLAGYEPAPGTRPRWFGLPVQRLGIALVGMLAAMTGVGGAALTIPMMTLAGVPMQKAVGTGSLLGLLVALPGMLGYIVTGWPHAGVLPPYSLGYVNLPAMLLVGILILPAAHFGVRAAYALDKKIVRRIFAGVLILVSLKMFFIA